MSKQTKTEPQVWEVKDRTYLLMGPHSPLTYTISSRHSRRFPLLWFDEDKKEQRESRKRHTED